MPTVEIRMPEEEKEGTEAAIGMWLKQPGDRVNEHEPVVEISTDKVTLEIPSPAAGVLGLSSKQPGDPVKPGDLLGTIETAGRNTIEEDARGPELPEPVRAPGSLVQSPAAFEPDAAAGTTLSPAVRRLLSELGLDPARIAKRSRGGRLTPRDIASHLASQTTPPPGSESRSIPHRDRPGRLVPHTSMRRSIASHMARSLATAPHVTAVFEADLSQVVADRQRRKEDDPAEPAPSVTAYLILAAIKAIRRYPEVNSRWHDQHVEIYDFVNFGVGTALDSGGLVVPVLHDAQDMDLLMISQRLREMTGKARAGKLTQSDMDDGTFTLSNHGVSGSLLAAPIVLPYGQAAILGTGKSQKRVVVCENGGRDLFRVRPMMYVTLTVDHRVLDAQQTNGFLTAFVAELETSPA